MTENRAHCRNCGEALVGAYCSHCGQREGRGDLSFKDVLSELLDELLNWDSRLWRTLVPLLFRPGFLTAEFIAGRRARYVPPFRLYLIISFVLFLVVSLLAGDTVSIITDGESSDRSGLSISAGDDDREIAGEGDASGLDVGISLADEDSPQWLKDLDQRIERNAKSLSGDPGEFVQLLMDYLPQMMFLLLPVFALLLKICYLFSPFHYLQHLVFTLHFHSFVYLLYLFGQLADVWFHGNALVESYPWVVLLYLPLALKRSYGSSTTAALGKGFVIVVADTLLLALAFAAVVVVALALM